MEVCKVAWSLRIIRNKTSQTDDSFYSIKTTPQILKIFFRRLDFGSFDLVCFILLWMELNV